MVESPLFSLIKITGSDAGTFLQGQLTQDIRALGETPSLPAAWCNPKGRVIAVMRAVKADGATGLVVPDSLAESIVQRLELFRLRAKVETGMAGGEWSAVAVAAADDLAALAALDLLPEAARNSARTAQGIVTVDIGASPRCIEVYGPASALERRGLVFQNPLSAEQWQLSLINGGIPLILAATSEKYTPHMLNLDYLGAISFSKGCYTGQEVVARTEHLGRSKRRLMHFRTDGPAVAVGDKLRHEEREVGEVVSSIGNDLLAVVPVELHEQTLSIAGARAAPVALPYSVPVSD